MRSALSDVIILVMVVAMIVLAIGLTIEGIARWQAAICRKHGHRWEAFGHHGFRCRRCKHETRPSA